MPEELELGWLDDMIEQIRIKRDRAATLGMRNEWQHFDTQLDHFMERRARFVREHNLDGGGDDAA